MKTINSLITLFLMTLTINVNAQAMDCSAHAINISKAIATALSGSGSASPVKPLGTKDGGENIQYGSVIEYEFDSENGSKVSFEVVLNYYTEVAPSAGCVMTSIQTKK